MIDFFFKKNISTDEIIYFLSLVFECEREDILLFEIKEFNEFGYQNIDNNIVCLGVFSEVHGDASLMINIYRYIEDPAVVLKKIVNFSTKERIACYTPVDDFDGWLLSGEEECSIRGVEIESEDSGFFFDAC